MNKNAVDKLADEILNDKEFNLNLNKYEAIYLSNKEKYNYLNNENIIKDKSSAREFREKILKSKNVPLISKIFPEILAIITVIFSFISFFIFVYANIDTTKKDVVIYILGVLSTILSQIFAFYFGSSLGSKIKTEILKKKIN